MSFVTFKCLSVMIFEGCLSVMIFEVLSFVAYDVCRIMTFVAYQVCRSI